MGVLEQLTNWSEVMETMLNILEVFPENVDVAGEVLAKKLQDNLAEYHGEVRIKVEVKIEERIYNVSHLGSEKNVRISFRNRLRSEVVFIVKRKRMMRSLRELAARGVADLVNSKDDIEDLEVPKV